MLQASHVSRITTGESFFSLGSRNVGRVLNRSRKSNPVLFIARPSREYGRSQVPLASRMSNRTGSIRGDAGHLT